MVSTFTTNKSLEQPANGDDVDTWDVPVNANSSAIDAAFGGTTALNATAASGVVTLTTTQYRPPFITITGALTSAVNYQVPSGVGGEWSISNATTGAFAITFSSAGGGTTVTLPQGKRTNVQSDGTNVIIGPAASGANADITSLSGLTTPLSPAQGGTGLTSFTAGTDYAAPGTATTFTATQTFSGSTTALAEILSNVAEVVTVSATAATGTIAYFISSQSVLYFTSNASANWTINLTFASGHTLDSVLSAGHSVTVTHLVTQGATAFFNSTVQVDGTTSGVTTKWLNGAPSAGDPSSIDAYTYVVIKTGSGAFTVLASLVPFN